MRDALPHAFLWVWLLAFLALNAMRLMVSRLYRERARSAHELNVRARFAVIANSLGGAAWGTLAATVILFGRDAPDEALLIFFILATFATFQAANPSRYPAAYYGWLACSMAPTLVAAALQPGEMYRTLTLVGTLFVAAVSLIGRHSYLYLIASITKRQENERLMEDLTRQKETLDVAIRAKTHFLAAASHDLRQPMQAAVLLVESLQERVTDPETRKIVRSIRSSVRSMAALLNAILDISRFDAGTVKPERSHFRVNNVLDRLRTSFAQQAAERNLNLHVLRSSAVIESDQILLYRILANIVGNALRYTERGRVLVGCRRRAGSLVIEVWDTGPGIPEDELGEIFREFYQLGNPARDRDQGLGLGLAIVDRTTKLLDHPLRVRSRVGHGSMFSVQVPLGSAEGIQSADRSRRADWASLEGCMVLVVDDETEIRAAMTILLEGWGCRVTAVASAAEVRDWLAASSDVPDVVVSDYRLPGEQNGINVIHLVRETHPGTVGILVTGDIAPQVLRDAEASGFKLLHKPLRPARLRSLLGNAWRDRVASVRALEQHETA